MTLELYFHGPTAKSLGQLAEELQRQGVLVPDVPRECDGGWSLVAHTSGGTTEHDGAWFRTVAALSGATFEGWGFVGPLDRFLAGPPGDLGEPQA